MSEPRPSQDRYTDEEWKAIIDGLDEEEREILGAIERGELARFSDPELEKALPLAAQNTLAKPVEIKIRIQELYARLAEQRAEELGVTREELLVAAIEKFLTDPLVQKPQTEPKDALKPLPRRR